MIKTLIKHHIFDHCISVMFDRISDNFRKKPTQKINMPMRFSVKVGELPARPYAIRSREESMAALKSQISKYSKTVKYPYTFDT